VALLLQSQSPAIHVDAFLRQQNTLAINPMCLDPGHVTALLHGLRKAMA
jgi:hypothetical protein